MRLARARQHDKQFIRDYLHPQRMAIRYFVHLYPGCDSATREKYQQIYKIITKETVDAKENLLWMMKRN